jgi:hypothetical protein
MKKIILLSVAFTCFQVETEANSFASNYSNTTISATNSNKPYKRRRKKGFLWGLFKKKDCGCPKH